MTNGRLYGQPLTVKVKDGQLVIAIGAQVLAHAATYGDWSHEYEQGELHGEYIRRFAITDATQFAKDVLSAMLHEREDGSTPLSDFIDKMSEAALDDGSTACDYDQHIPHGEHAPSETWALTAQQEKPDGDV